MTFQQYSLSDSSQSEGSKRPQRRFLKKSSDRGRSLSKQLLQTLLPLALLPLAVASGLSVLVTRRIERESALLLLKEESFLASEAASVFVEDNVKVIEAALLNPSITQALRQSNAGVEENGLINQPVESLEQQFEQTKLLQPNAALNQYLADVSEVTGMEEISITERNGFNVAYSSPISDFVQSDEDWWLEAKQTKQFIEIADSGDSANIQNVSIAKTVGGSAELLGVMKAIVPVTVMNERIATYAATVISGSQQIQIVDTLSSSAFSTIGADEITSTQSEVVGGDSIIQAAQVLTAQLGQAIESVETLKQALEPQLPGKLVELDRVETATGQIFLTLLLEYQGKEYSLTTVPTTPWVAISSVNISEINSAGNDLVIIFVSVALVLGVAITFLLRLFSEQLSAPLKTLTETAQTATSGDLEVRANPSGTSETQILGQSFNNLLEQIQLLLTRQTKLTEEQRAERENLENDITQLMEDVGGAADGDLSVRAKLSSNDVGIVADLVNAIIENLRDIAVNVKESTGDVSQSLLTNEQQIRMLAEQAIEEAVSMKSTMVAVEAMDQSIQTVADSASQASDLTNDTYTTAQVGSQSMEQTADSILELRSTVGETSKKIKRLGESAQKIAQAISLIDEIALKTNLLAVNASVEASRAGELGQGFTAVAEQVGALAEQSAGATKTIAQIVAEIQTETQEVVTAIETGTAQVVESSQRVQTTQQQLEQVLAKSEKINQLMQNISTSTVDQTKASTTVTELMQKATQASEQRSQASAQVAQAIRDTAKVAQELQSSVEQFKVEG
ncbi:MAG: methyl-accepting chemotaxis protein [Cyanobacteria bacterium P01_H01_bin.26]